MAEIPVEKKGGIPWWVWLLLALLLLGLLWWLLSDDDEIDETALAGTAPVVTETEAGAIGAATPAAQPGRWQLAQQPVVRSPTLQP